jgi:hypothetical protein
MHWPSLKYLKFIPQRYVGDTLTMTSKTVILLIVLIPCVIAASYLTRLIIAERASRMTFGDKCMLREWVNLLREYPEMQDLPSRADAAVSWAKTAAEDYITHSRGASKEFTWHGMLPFISPENCPAGLTAAQAELIRKFVWRGLNSGAWETRDRPTVTWKDELTGSIPQWDKRPSDCLNPHFLDKYPYEPLEQPPYRWNVARPEEVVANREALDRLANNDAMLQLIDQIWQIGYDAGRRISYRW